MKPIYMKIAGLNSFREEQEVDFTSLGESGLFGIFGPTGSGKSTVLDAVTLALYGKVERAKGGTQGIINQNEDKLYVYFSFQVGKQKYTAERTYRRGNDGSINQYSCRLLVTNSVGNNTVLAEKKREMDEKIQEILGLTVDDFTRAVVLPQGKFQEFLTLQGADRRKMLQRIFALEKYGEELVKKIRQRVNNTEQRLEITKQTKDILGDASETAIKKAKKDLKEKMTMLSDLTEKLTVFKEQEKEYIEIRQLTQELVVVNEALRHLAQEETEIKIKIEKLELAQKGEYLRPYLKQVMDGEKAIKDKEVIGKNLENELNLIKNHWTESDIAHKTWENKYLSEGKRLEGSIVKLEGAFGDEIIRDGYLRKLLEHREEYRKLDNSMKILQDENIKLETQKFKQDDIKLSIETKMKEYGIILDQAGEIEKQREAWQELLEAKARQEELTLELRGKEKQIQETVARKNTLAEQIVQNETIIIQIQKELEAIPLPSLDQGGIYKEQTQLQGYIALIDNIKDQELSLNNQEKELKENTILLVQQEGHFKESTKALAQLEIERKVLLEKIAFLEEKKQSIDEKNYALTLRKTLQPGEPCPVCGSLEHPSPLKSFDGKEDLLEEVARELKGEKEELSLTEKEIQDVQQLLANTKAYLIMLKEKNTQLNQGIEELQIKARNTRVRLPQEWIGEELVILCSLIEKKNEALKVMQKMLAEGEIAKKTLSENLKENENKLIELRQKISGFEAETRLLDADRKNIQDKMAVVEETKKLKEINFETISGPKSGSEVEELFQELKVARENNQKLEQEKNLILKELEDTTTNLNTLEKKLQEQIQSRNILENEGKTYRELSEKMTDKINEITLGQKAEDAKKQAEAELKAIVDNLNKYKEELEKTNNQLEEKNRDFHIITQEISNLNNAQSEYRKVLWEKMTEAQFVSLGQLTDALCTEIERQELTETIKKYHDRKLLAQENGKNLAEKLGERSLSEEAWGEFQKNKSELEEEKKKEDEEGYRLKHQLANLEEKHGQWLKIDMELKELTTLIDQLGRLDKLFRGNTFVEFIVEEQLRNVAIDASRRLGDLTNYRYSLEIDSDGGFIIRDDANGGLKRPVATLSGGETFLTSLALALALSSQIQLKGKYPLEFFFLDEGFGTLDSYLLETVMNSLERLHLEKMTIGIISHVPELKARIPRSLVVEPAEKGGRGTRLKVEMA